MRTILLCILLGLSATAADLPVPGGYATITAAIAAAQPGDRIVVAAGTYAPSTNGESFPLDLATAGLSLVGAGSEATILDAEGTALVVSMSGAARLAHCTITGGNGNWGGGIDVSAGDPELDHLWVLANGALRRGSGINIQNDASPWIHHNVIYGSFDTDLVHVGDPHGIQVAGTSQAVVEHNLIAGGDSNGLIAQEAAAPLVRNNIFYDNGIDGLRGRGICALSDPATVIAYNLFFENSIAALVVPGPTNLSASEANDFASDDNIYENLDGDPLLGNLALSDFLLASAGSPAIDAGDPTSPLDPDGSRADIGPYYYGFGSTGNLPAAGGLQLMRYGPNPTAGLVEFALRSARRGRLQLEVIDLRGRRVTVESRQIGVGESGFAWNGAELAQGLYFVRLRIGPESVVAPLIVAR